MPPARSKTAARKATPRRKPGAASGVGKLALYNTKRDFSKTREPQGAHDRKAKGDRFVVQQHDATRMHYDFRLEIDGVLVSWAVPKGPSLDPKVRRLSVQTEDHPLSYRDFEGDIPESEYGGGPVIVWDRGRWQCEGDAAEQLQKGHLRFQLAGEKLHGGWSLVRTGGKNAATGPKSAWLLIKRDDADALRGDGSEITQRLPLSVISGRPVSGATPPKSPRSKVSTPRKVAKPRGKSKGKATPSLKDLELQLATLAEHPPTDAEKWVYEIKFDGYRALARIEAGQATLRSRNGLDWSKTFPRITAALERLEIQSAVLDGEVCHVDDEGHTSFQRLQNVLPRGGTGEVPREQSRLVYYIFDLLFHDGNDLRAEAFLERKRRLEGVLGTPPPLPLMLSRHLEADGRLALNQACAAGLEGLIAKRVDAPYRPGRGKDWLKLKCNRRQEFVIVGWTPPQGSRSGFGSLVIAVREGEALVYRGKVGTGFSRRSIDDVLRRLKKLTVEHSPLAKPPRLPGVTWVKPELVCEVAFTEVTNDGSLRHPSFQGLREDKPVRDVVQEEAVAPPEAKPTKGRTSDIVRGGDTVGGVHISHPERILDKVLKLTKLELARYHHAVAEWSMPYIENRPLSIVRCPQGDAAACFFQTAKVPGLSDAVRRQVIAGHETIHVDVHEGVLELVQFNAIELHGWGARARDPDRADWIVMDLDPDPSVAFPAVVEAALEMRDALAQIGLRSFVKTTGGKGLHVVAPIIPEHDWDTVKGFTQAVALAFAKRWPDRFVATISKAKRAGKIFVDYLRNGRGATAILPYSPRARPGAPVAMPIEWKDVAKVDPLDFDVRSAQVWLKKRRKDPWRDFFDVRQPLPMVK